MTSTLFTIIPAETHYVLALSLPISLDTVDVDRLMEDVLAGLVGKASGRWVMDLTEVQYMGSAMLGLVVNVRQKVQQAKGKLALCGLTPELLAVFHTCCLERLFTLRKTREEAVAAVGG